MSEDTLLKKLAQIVITNNQTLLTAVDEKIQGSEKRIKEELEQKIDASQKDTIEVLSELIHTGYNLHEERIQRIEDRLQLSHLTQ